MVIFIKTSCKKNRSMSLKNSIKRHQFFNSYFSKLLLKPAYFVSFPKSGRTWIRSLLLELVNHEFDVKLNKVENLRKIHPLIPYIHFTHGCNPHLRKHYEISIDYNYFLKTNVIFILRDPRDVLVSWYYHYKYKGGKKEESLNLNCDSLFEFINNDIGGLKSIINFYNDWINFLYGSKKNNSLVLSYEEFQKNPINNFKIALKFLKIESLFSKKSIEYAINECSFDRLKEKEQNMSIDYQGFTSYKDENSMKVRKGEIGGFQNEFSIKEIEYLNQYLLYYLDTRLINMFTINES